MDLEELLKLIENFSEEQRQEIDNLYNEAERITEDLTLRPYPNEHSARLQDPGKFDKDSYRRTKGGTIYGKIKVPQTISIIWGKLKTKNKPSDPPIPQALRFPTKNWTAEAAKKWLKDNKVKYIKFEPASDSHKTEADITNRFNNNLTVRGYELNFKTLNKKNRSVEAVIATETPVMVIDLEKFERVYEVLLMSGCRIPDTGQVPMHDTHDRTTIQKQLGSTRDLHIEGDTLIGRNYFVKSNDDAEHAWQLVEGGHLTDNSIGYKNIAYQTIEKGETLNIQGKDYTAPADRNLRVVIDWIVRENSVCSVGADDKAKMRKLIDYSYNGKDLTMDEFKKWLTERGLNYDDLEEKQRTALKADYDALQKRDKDPETPKDKDKDKNNEDLQRQNSQENGQAPQSAEEAIRAERERTKQIRDLAGKDVPTDIVQRAIEEGTTIEDFKDVVLKHIRKGRENRITAPGVIVYDTNVNRQLIEDAIIMRSGNEDIILSDKNEGAKRAEQADKARDICLLDVCRYALQLENKAVPISRGEIIRAAVSTMALTYILGNVANKSMMKGYDSTPETWRRWCNIGSASDFKTMTKTRLTDLGDLEEVGSGGEVVYGSAGEEYEQYHISTYAKNFAITRQQIINDDLDALTKQPKNMGIRAKNLISKLVYIHLLANGNMSDGVALFASGHSNLNTGAALAAAALRAAVQILTQQTDKDGQQIDVPPSVLLVPPGLWLLAAELVKSSTIVITGSTDAERGSSNVLSDLNLTVVSEPRLANSSYTGYSATSWYLMGDKNVVDTIEVAFLNGRQEPTLEKFDMTADRMGIIYRIYQDAGCKALDFRGMQKNTT